MKIAIIGKFQKIHDEEYIARSFEKLGHSIIRIPETLPLDSAFLQIVHNKCRLVLYFKLNTTGDVRGFIRDLRAHNILAVCWAFDLYWGYPREYRLNAPSFKMSDYMFSTDGGNDARFRSIGINHFCIRQGIYDKECFMDTKDPIYDIVFVGSENPLHPYRQKMLEFIKFTYGDRFKWFGRTNTDEVRGVALNELYSKSKIIIGDSVPSPKYWSNRVVETLGRGGFLIHPDVEGIREEYPDLVTYKHGDFGDLKEKIDTYLKNEKERNRIRKSSYKLVKENYTMDKKCDALIKCILNSEKAK